MKSGETERAEGVVAQRLWDRRVTGHAPEPRRRQTPMDRTGRTAEPKPPAVSSPEML